MMNFDYDEELDLEVEFPIKNKKRGERRKRKFSDKYPNKEYTTKHCKAWRNADKKRTRQNINNIPSKAGRKAFLNAKELRERIA